MQESDSFSHPQKMMGTAPTLGSTSKGQPQHLARSWPRFNTQLRSWRSLTPSCLPRRPQLGAPEWPGLPWTQAPGRPPANPALQARPRSQLPCPSCPGGRQRAGRDREARNSSCRPWEGPGPPPPRGIEWASVLRGEVAQRPRGTGGRWQNGSTAAVGAGAERPESRGRASPPGWTPLSRLPDPYGRRALVGSPCSAGLPEGSPAPPGSPRRASRFEPSLYPELGPGARWLFPAVVFPEQHGTACGLRVALLHTRTNIQPRDSLDIKKKP